MIQTVVDAADVDLVAVVAVAALTGVAASRRRAAAVQLVDVAVLVGDHVVIVVVVVVRVLGPVARRPLHLVLLLQSTTRVREPRRHLQPDHVADFD